MPDLTAGRAGDPEPAPLTLGVHRFALAVKVAWKR